MGELRQETKTWYRVGRTWIRKVVLSDERRSAGLCEVSTVSGRSGDAPRGNCGAEEGLIEPHPAGDRGRALPGNHRDESTRTVYARRPVWRGCGSVLSGFARPSGLPYRELRRSRD